jgi:DMSO/TMAO reductase YedYZ molybdopterin-dependent catalytic subunit
MTIHHGRWYRLARGALSGVLAAGAAIGVGELVAAFVRPSAAPVVAVGTRLITLTPEPVKEFAIRRFGEDDKTVLLAGIYAVLAAIAVLAGMLAARRLAIGLTAFAAFGLVGVAAAITTPAAGPLDVLPSALAAAAGAATLVLLDEASGRRGTARAGDDPRRRDRTAEPPDGTRHQDHAIQPSVSDQDGVDRPAAPEGVAVSRRRLVLFAVGAGVVAVGGGVGGRVLQGVWFAAERSRALVRLPGAASPARAVPVGAQLDVPGIGRWRTPTTAFYRVDTALTVPQVAADTWKLRVHGKVDHPVTITYDQLLKRSLIERDITLTCVSNEVGGPYIGNARWLGAGLAALLREAGIHSDADQLVSRSADGMTIGTPTSAVLDGRDAMLAVGMNGQPLPVEHGFPVRMVVPGLYGYVSACKWIVDLEATTFGAYDAYWVSRGWAQQGPIKTESRIDTPRDGASKPAGTVQVAGVAWAQHRGIRKVEVQVDGGAWHAARLAAAPTTDTWRQWVWSWPATKGDHTIRVRATDTAGTTQTADEAPPLPDGATGYHTISVKVH